MSVAEKLTTVAENMPKVYEAGQMAERERFWYEYTTISPDYWVYRFAGHGWNSSTFKPTKDLIVKGTANGLFRETGIVNLTKCLADNNVILDISGVTNTSYLFGFATKTTNISMKISEPNEVSSIAFVSTSFQSCTALTTLYITGILGTNGLDLHWSTKLDKESLVGIINILQDKSAEAGTWTVTFGSTNLAKLTDTEKAAATQKGWTLA